MKQLPFLGEDSVLPFQLEASLFRGRLVHLGPTLDMILHQHAYPMAVGCLLGEAMVLAAALSNALKFEGVFTFQVKSDGPVTLLLADVTSDGGIRAYAQHRPLDNVHPYEKLLGAGYLAFTIDQNQKQDRYQGIVALEGENIAESVQHYFRQSEQIPTGLIAHVNQDEHGRWHGGCLMLQKMPREGGLPHETESSAADDWHRAMMLMGTCEKNELIGTSVSPEELLFRLFHEDGVRVFEPHGLRHQCRCSQERVSMMLLSLPEVEVEDLAVNDVVSVTCEFCNTLYSYDGEQRKKLYQTR